MDRTETYLHLDALNAPVALRVDDAYLRALPAVFANWPFDLRNSFSEQPFASVTLNNTGYALTSPFMEETVTHSDPVDSLCALVVEIAWARLRQNTRLLCLHGAAVEFSGRLVVFPSTRRAGKSTLTVALASAGKTVFTDDFLPLQIGADNRIEGLSNGISPRLRLPAPPQFGLRASQYITARQQISNARYQYVVPRGAELARFNQSAPLGALVFLERVEGQPPELEETTAAEALRALITQNFSRAMNAAGILKVLGAAAEQTPAYRLRYDAVEPAIALLETRFSEWQTPAATFNEPPEDTLFASALETDSWATGPDVETDALLQAPGITEVATNGERFLSGRNGKSIHNLNDGAAMIWRLLEEPSTASEIIGMLHAVFPEQKIDTIRSDVMETLRAFAANGLLVSNAEICQSGEIRAETVPEHANGKQ